MTKEQEDNTQDLIQIRIQNKNPKKDPITYKLVTVQDIADCVTVDNIDGFLKDFRMCLESVLLMKLVYEEHKKKGEIPQDSKVIMPHIEWTDDWKPKRKKKTK